MPRRPIAPTDLYGLRAVTSVDLHPDGQTIVYTIGWPDRETDENRSELWLRRSDGSDELIATGGHRDLRPRFSPDGERLAFLRATPDRPPQPAIIDLDDEEGSQGVVIVEGFEDDGALAVEWIDEARIAVSAPRRPADQVGLDADELARQFRVIDRVDYRFNDRGWTHDRPVQLLVVTIDSGDVRNVIDGERTTAGLAVSSDGSWILTTVPTDDADLSGENTVVRFAVDGSSERALTPAGGRWSVVGWVDQAEGPAPVAIGSTRAGSVTLGHLHRLDPAGVDAPHRVGDHDVSAAALVGDGGRVVDVGKAALTLGVRRGTVTVDRHDLTDDSSCSTAAIDGVVTSFAASTDGERIVAAASTPTRPAELWEFTDGEATVLRSLNDDLLAELDLVEPETVQIPSTDGVTVEAFVLRPPSSAGDAGASPGLVFIHGGPMFSYGLGFFDEFQVAAAAGYTVIGGNPRGSDGYGEDWAATLTGRLGTIDAEDVTAIADHLASLDEVDADRIGIGGGSYGGFMTSWMIGHTDRFKAALVERAVTNWESFAGTSDIGSWFGPMLLDATVEDDVAALRTMSPLTYAANVTTPTMILHAEEDWRCPIEQAEQLFAAYRRNGVDVTFVRIPGENHELTRRGTPRHRAERFELVMDFFDRHLKP